MLPVIYLLTNSYCNNYYSLLDRWQPSTRIIAGIIDEFVRTILYCQYDPDYLYTNVS